MIIHTVCFSLHHPAGSEEERSFLATAREVLPAIGAVQDFAVRRQIGSQSALRFQFSMTFASQADYDSYNADPRHVDFVETRWKPEVSDFTEFDFAEFDFEPDAALGR